MYRSQLVARRQAPQLATNTLTRTRTPMRTFISSSPRAVGGPTTGPSNDGDKKSHGKPFFEPFPRLSPGRARSLCPLFPGSWRLLSPHLCTRERERERADMK